MNAKEISKHLQKMENKEDARFLQGFFFKTGNRTIRRRGIFFLGIRVPAIRKLAKDTKICNSKEILINCWKSLITK